jgi:hypothetical protein
LLQPGEGPVAARQFVNAWRASRQATWAIDATFERRTARGGRVMATTHRAQAPPDRMASALGSVDAVLHGRHLDCSTDGRGRQHCIQGAVAKPYDQEVADELTTLRSYVLGAPPLYVVRQQDHGCFRLRLVVSPYPSPPYGQEARFCWDPVSHAPVRVEVHRAEGADVTVTFAIRRQPTQADLTPPA